jgi:hypothetical protein
MSIYKLAAGLTALAFGAALVTAISGVSAEVKDSIGPVPLAAKGDAAKGQRIDVRPVASACPQEPWPYGCVWRAPPTRRVARSTRPL